MNNKGEPYKVFTSFYKSNRSNLRQRQPYPYQLKELTSKIVNSSEDYTSNYKNKGSDEKAFQTAWNEFLDNDILNYDSNREYLPELLTSQLSIALAYGFLDINAIFRDLLENYDEDESNYESFIRELIFREFYYVLMVNYPKTAHQSFNEKYRGMKWSHSKQNFNAWASAQTGYPIIDAAINELVETGYMHNRMRMVVSQFLTKDLFIDWTWGEKLFNQYLIDYDAASNVHGWQWSASTGTDAVPYFRMFNPIRQSERFDKDALYIKKFIPILNEVPAQYLHDPYKHEEKLKQYDIKLGEDYPKPIVNHKKARDYVMEQFKKY